MIAAPRSTLRLACLFAIAAVAAVAAIAVLAGCKSPINSISLQLLNPKDDIDSGIGLSFYNANELGGFVAVKASTSRFESDDAPHFDGTVDMFGDPGLGREREFATINAGFTFTPAPDFGFYAGLGLTYLEEHYRYSDPTLARSSNGSYVLDTRSDTRVNTTFGFLFWLDNGILFEFGYDSMPRGFNAGMGFTF